MTAGYGPSLLGFIDSNNPAEFDISLLNLFEYSIKICINCINIIYLIENII